MSLTGIIKSLKGKFARLVMGGKYIDNHFEKDYMEEVKVDIKFFERAKHLTKHGKNQDPLTRHLIKRYSENYCPCSWYGMFSKKDKERYAMLRVRIDELLP